MGKLYQKYGSVIIKKGSILYHVGSTPFLEDINSRIKPFLFCTFHPSEWSGKKYVHYIRLERDVRLLFMISETIDWNIISALPDIMPHVKNNMEKTQLHVQEEMKEKLEKEYYDGWFSSIENSATVEVALLSAKNIFSYVKSEKIKRAWRNGNCVDNGNIVCKNWGKYYPISFLDIPIKFHLNKRYHKILKRYKKYEIKEKYIGEFIFQIMLNNASIKYHES